MTESWCDWHASGLRCGLKLAMICHAGFNRQQQDLVIVILADAFDAIIQEFLAPTQTKVI